MILLPTLGLLLPLPALLPLEINILQFGLVPKWLSGGGMMLEVTPILEEYMILLLTPGLLLPLQALPPLDTTILQFGLVPRWLSGGDGMEAT